MATEDRKQGNTGTTARPQRAGQAQDDYATHKRRTFLVAASGTGIIGALAAIFGRASQPHTAPIATVAEQPAVTSSGGGYRETEHIRKYYNCARYF